MQIPVTDAFDETDSLDTLEVKLTPKQIDWLRQKADDRNLSLDHVLRSIVTTQIREDAMERSGDSRSGDGATHATGTPSSDTETSEPDDKNRTSSSIVESLRSARERLDALTAPDEAADAPVASSPPSYLHSELQPPSPSENPSELDETEDPKRNGEPPSMFDLVDE